MRQHGHQVADDLFALVDPHGRVLYRYRNSLISQDRHGDGFLPEEMTRPDSVTTPRVAVNRRSPASGRREPPGGLAFSVARRYRGTHVPRSSSVLRYVDLSESPESHFHAGAFSLTARTHSLRL